MTKDFLEKLKSLLPIQDLMGRYIKVTRRGRTYVCLCPFHSEKSPSCTIYPETGSFYCFGCGAGGDIISFIRQYEHLDYREAVNALAGIAGVQVPLDTAVNKEESRMKGRILELNREAARFFYKGLLEDGNKKGLRYFAERGLRPETLKKYGLGYAPNSWDTLTKAMTALGYTQKELLAAGLVKEGKSGVYDAFRDRVIFPILDLRGQVIGFGGRILDGDGPKYLNSPDTLVFKKSRNLFSLNMAKTAPETQQRLILAEGYMDVIAVNQGGFENVVATLGTALTGDQARLMAQHTKEVIISYDSDGPGQKAANKAVGLLGEAGVSTKILKLEGAKDPDEYIKKFGSTRFKLLLDNALGAVNFQLERAAQGLDTASQEGQVDYLKRAAEVLSEINSPLEREVYISRLAGEQRISPEAIKNQVNMLIRRREKGEKAKNWQAITSSSALPIPLSEQRQGLNLHSDSVYTDASEAAAIRKSIKAEALLMAYILRYPDRLPEILKVLSTEAMFSAVYQRAYSLLAREQENTPLNGASDCLSVLGGELSGSEMGKITEIIAKNRDIDIGPKEAADYVEVIKTTRENLENGPSKTPSDQEFLAFTEGLRAKQDT